MKIRTIRRIVKCLPTILAASLFLSTTFLASAADPEGLEIKMEEAYRIQPGMTVEQLMNLFVREPGFVRVITDDEWREIKTANDVQAWKKIDTTAYTFRLKSCSLIKIDVKFVAPRHELWDQAPGTVIKWTSKPYLQKPILDETE